MSVLDPARDAVTFETLTNPYRRELTVHCYRIAWFTQLGVIPPMGG